jgi:hypothetical protein
LDAAEAALQAAIDGLRSAEAALRAARTVTAKPPPTRGITPEGVARFAVGFVGGAAKSVVTVAVGTAVALGTCALNCTSTVQSVANAGAGVIADPGAAVRNTANGAASTIGRLREDLPSGDGFRTGGAVAEVTVAASSFIPPVAVYRATQVERILNGHLNNALVRFQQQGFTLPQANRLATNPELEAAFAGE